MTAARELVALNKPANKDHQSLTDYMYNSQPLCDDETEWAYKREDLVTLRPGREHAWLDASVEHLLKWLKCDAIEVWNSATLSRLPMI